MTRSCCSTKIGWKKENVSPASGTGIVAICFPAKRRCKRFRNRRLLTRQPHASWKARWKARLADPTRQLVAKPVVDSRARISGENNPRVSQTRIDLIELNQVQDQDGRPVFDQLILWSTNPDGKLHIRDWRIQKTPEMLTRQADLRVCQWISRQKGSAGTDEMTVAAPAFQETTSIIDPELEDRKEVQRVDRIPLWKR